MNEHEQPRSRIAIAFKRSSTKDGVTGYEVYVGEGADQREADRLFAIAEHLRGKAEEVLHPKSTLYGVVVHEEEVDLK